MLPTAAGERAAVERKPPLEGLLRRILAPWQQAEQAEQAEQAKPRHAGDEAQKTQ